MATTSSASRDRARSPSMIRACRQCGSKNRIPAARLADRGRCGSCKAELPPVDAPVAADEALFDAVVAGAPVPVLVDFWAEWCGPCKMAGPEVARVAAAMAGRAVVLKVNVDDQPRLAARFGISSIPTFAVFRRGELVRQQPGLMNHRQLQALLGAA